jgi:hypothetical protein
MVSRLIGHYMFMQGRGGTVKLADLNAALRGGVIGGAGLDVFETEPLPADHALWDAPNFIMTPHSACTQIQGGAGSAAVPSGAPGQRTKWQERCIEIVRHNLSVVVEGAGEFRNAVDKEKWY